MVSPVTVTAGWCRVYPGWCHQGMPGRVYTTACPDPSNYPIYDLGLGYWALALDLASESGSDPGSDPGSWILTVEPWILDSDRRILDPGL